MQDKAQRLADRAKMEILSDKGARFFGFFLMRYPVIWNEEIKTADIGGKVLYVNPTFFLAQTPLQAAGLLLHELLHIAFKHPIRGLGKEDIYWQYACDFWVNSWVLNNTKLQLPDNGLYNSMYHWEMAVEDIYQDLLTRKPDVSFIPWGEDDCDPSKMDVANDSQAKIQETCIDSLMLQAAILEEQQGDGLFEGVARIVHKLRNPVLPWERILQQWARDRGYTGYNWSKPNSRYNFYFPTRKASGFMKKMVAAIDVSGSITQRQFDYIIGQIEQARILMAIEECTVILFDDVVVATYTLREGQPISSVELKGGGGTDLNPMLEAANAINPDVLVVFTDMHVYNPTVSFKGDSVWLVLDNPKREAPFGKTIHIDVAIGDLC